MSFPLPTFGDSDDLLFRLTRGRSGAKRHVVFLVGSALTAPVEPGGPGVPRVAGVVELIREEFSESPDALNKLDAQLAEEPSDSYQRAFGFLQNNFGQDRANRVVRRAVLQARLESETSQTVLDGEAQACQALEKDLDGWTLSPAVEAMGRILAALPQPLGRWS